jgi:uncharacterized protein (DUF433 family)
MRKQYSATFKADMVREILKEEKTLSQLASESGVHPTQLKEWKKIAIAGLPELFSNKGQRAEKLAQQHEQRVEELYAEYPFFGSRRIAVPLGLEEMTVNRKAVQRHMREMGIAVLQWSTANRLPLMGESRWEATMQELDRITFDPHIMGGRACIRGMRITVSLILNLVANGQTTEQILDDYPYPEAEDVEQALRYAAWLAEDSIYPLPALAT